MIVVAGLLASLGAAGLASADDGLDERLSRTRDRLGGLSDRELVLTQTIAGLDEQVEGLRGQVARARNREARVEGELAQVQSELGEAEAVLAKGQARLRRVRDRLNRAITALSDRLVAIYKSGDPGLLTVVLNSDGFDDLLERSEYLRRLEDADSRLVARVGDLRDQRERIVERRKDAVERIGRQRELIAAKRERLEGTRIALERRETGLVKAEKRRTQALDAVKDQKRQLERIEAGLEGRVRATLAAADPGPLLPAGPIRQGSGEMIWPINGRISSPFGPRWGRLHAGLDISAPAGTPIRAARAGSVVLASPYGGYGNYTCVNHGGGLSSCYAHQQSIATSRGASVDQGEVIGYVGNTGNSFGNHLHFEVRVGGTPQDPLGYL